MSSWNLSPPLARAPDDSREIQPHNASLFTDVIIPPGFELAKSSQFNRVNWRNKVNQIFESASFVQPTGELNIDPLQIQLGVRFTF